jgi:hypothetical protein
VTTFHDKGVSLGRALAPKEPRPVKKRRLWALAALPIAATATACTPRERAMWDDWHARDPEAAVEFASKLPPQRPAEAPARHTSGGTVWDRLAQCESGGNWSINTGNGYYGGLQFLPSTWRSSGGSGMPHQHSREEQIRVAENLRRQAGFRPWPQCAAKLGLL